MKTVKAQLKCAGALGVAFLGGIALLACFACGSEAETVETSEPTTQPTQLRETASTVPPEKLAFEEAERQREEAAQNASRAPKFPEPSAVLSCPTDLTKLATGIVPYDSRYQPPPLWRQGTLVNIASVISAEGVPYSIYAGTAVDPQQGVIVVEELTTDVCAATAGLVPRPPEPSWHQTPYGTGAITLTRVDSDAVDFTTADGSTGRLEYTTGQFLAEAAAP